MKFEKFGRESGTVGKAVQIYRRYGRELVPLYIEDGKLIRSGRPDPEIILTSLIYNK